MVRFLGFLAVVALALLQTSQASTMQDNSIIVPEILCSSYGAYPNPLGITDEDRASFHPVIKFPTIWSDSDSSGGDGSKSKNKNKKNNSCNRIRIADLTVEDNTRPSGRTQMATEEERTQRTKELQSIPKWMLRIHWRVRSIPLVRKLLLSHQKQSNKRQPLLYYGIGRYDENRIGMYSSEMFQNTENNIDGYAGARTVHVGIDLAGPLGTAVLAFSDGVIHSVGYNAELGDYGNVMVIEHTVPSNGRKLWVLYGHLGSTRGKLPGQRIRKGQRIGRLGDIDENGGWHLPHVHFQISTEAPETHDMPGAVAVEDRLEALQQYPDPRYVLGELY